MLLLLLLLLVIIFKKKGREGREERRVESYVKNAPGGCASRVWTPFECCLVVISFENSLVENLGGISGAMILVT